MRAVRASSSLRTNSLAGFFLLLASFASAAVPAPATAGPTIDVSLLAGLKARSIGPAGMSGRVAAIDAVVANPDLLYAGAATGGVWKSVNGGLSFTPVFDREAVAAIGSIAIFQPNPDIVWVGTGEGNVRNSASVGNGIYRTLDGGKTWRHMGLEKTERLHRVLTHPSDPDTVWACAPGQEWGENADRGVFKTEDGGKTWRKVLFVDERTGCGDLAMDPANPNKLFAGMWQFRRWPYFFRSGGPGSGLHLTTDGGETWKRLSDRDGLPKGDLGRIGIAISRSNPEVVYANVEAEKPALLRSKDGGKSFESVNERHDVNPRPFYFCDLRVDPQWPMRVYSVDYEIRVSDDGGKNFRSLVRWDQIHGDHHALWIDPNNPHHLYVGNDGGVAVSNDRGETSRFVANLPLAQFYHVAVDDAVPYNVYGGLQDNGSWRGPSAVWQGGGIRNHHWRNVGWGDGFDVQPDPFDANLVYSMWQGGNLGRFDLRTGENRDIKPAGPEGVRLRFNWNAGLATDARQAGTIYYGSQFVHRSRDRGETWETISPDLTQNNPAWQRQDETGGLTPDVTAAENYGTIVALAQSPLAPEVLWVGTDDGRLHVSRDGGATWTSVEKNVKGVPQGAWVPHVEPSPHAAGTAFVTFDDHRRGDLNPYVVLTEDYGKTWKSLASKDLSGYALRLVQDPVKPELLFLGTEFGLWVSFDRGANWQRYKHGVPTVSVMDLAIQRRENDLVLGTHGRALYVLDDLRPLREMTAELQRSALHLFSLGEARQHWGLPEDGGFGFGAGEFRGANRDYGALITFWLGDEKLPHPDDDVERAKKETEREAALKKATWGPEPPKPAVETEKGDKADASQGDEKPKAEIRVVDGGGKLVRFFKTDARRGLNRVAWALDRDAFRQPPQDPPSKDEYPGGPEVTPGDYVVSVKFGDHEAKGTVRVLQDPRSANTPSDWAARETAIGEVGALRERLVRAIERIASAGADLDAISAKLAERKKDAPKGEKPADDPLDKQIGDVRKALDGVEKKVWQPLKAKGILPDTDAMSKVYYAWGHVTSSWAPPSPTHRQAIAVAAKAADEVLAEVDKVFAGPVADLSKAAGAAGISLLGN